VSKLLTYATVAFLLYYLVSDPRGAAAATTGLVDALGQAGQAGVVFVSDLSSG